MIDQYPSPNGVLTSLIWRKTMSGGETSLSGYDNASQALSYTPGQEQVYLNGILLVRGDDYTATNGTSITGLAALSASDFIQVNCYNNFSLASLPSTSITGEISNSQITSLATSKLTGTVANNQLANSSITINGSAVSLGGSTTIAGGSAQDDAPTSPTEGQLWLDTNGTLATTGFTEKATLTTTGDIYYASAASTPARLGIGSTGQVLTVSGGAPSWATPSVGGMTLLSTTTMSTATTTISNIDQTYNNLVVIMTGQNTPSYGGLNFDIDSVTNGFTGTTQQANQGGSAGNGQTINGRVSDQWSGIKAGDTNNVFVVTIYDYASTSRVKAVKAVYGWMGWTGTADALRAGETAGFWNSTSAVDSIRIELGSTPTAGTIRIYGVK